MENQKMTIHHNVFRSQVNLRNQLSGNLYIQFFIHIDELDLSENPHTDLKVRKEQYEKREKIDTLIYKIFHEKYFKDETLKI